MIAAGPARHWRLKRRTKRATLIALRIARRHYLSVVSLAVLTIALALAMTSGGFDGARPSPGTSAAAPAPRPRAVVVPATAPANHPPDEKSVVYYFIDSPEVRQAMEMAIHRDITDESLRDYAPLHSVSRVFIMIEDARDEAEALEFLRQLAIAPPDGANVRVVDLR